MRRAAEAKRYRVPYVAAKAGEKLALKVLGGIIMFLSVFTVTASEKARAAR